MDDHQYPLLAQRDDRFILYRYMPIQRAEMSAVNSALPATTATDVRRWRSGRVRRVEKTIIAGTAKL